MSQAILNRNLPAGSPRHVLVVAHAWYGDLIGGSFRLASEFAESLAERGQRVTYVCSAPNEASDIPLWETINGVHVRRYRHPLRPRRGLGRLRHHVTQTARLVEELMREPPIDVLSGHSPLQAFGAMRALRGQPVFKNYVVHSPFDDELLSQSSKDRPSFTLRLAGRLARWVDGWNVRQANCVQTDSQYTLKVMTAKHGDCVRRKGVVAPGWVDTERFYPVNSTRTLRRELGTSWDTDLPIFFTLRRLESRMGLETLIEAARLLRHQNRQFRVLIGGGGSLRDELARQIREAELEDCVHLLGRLPEQQVPRCYALADCFVLPTRALECFGLIVLESFAAETPVIASRVAAIPELAAHQGESWLFEPGNATQLAERMGLFLEGRLKPQVDLRGFALDYSRAAITKQWQSLLLDRSVNDGANAFCR